jgi:hypothetical protein
MQLQMTNSVHNMDELLKLKKERRKEQCRQHSKRRYAEYGHLIQNEIVQCVCGKYMCRNSINLHLKSKIHAQYMAIKNNPIQPDLVMKSAAQVT